MSKAQEKSNGGPLTGADVSRLKRCLSSGVAPQRFGKYAVSNDEVGGPESLEGFGKVEKAVGEGGFENADGLRDGEPTAIGFDFVFAGTSCSSWGYRGTS